MSLAKTLGRLKESGYRPRTVKDELRQNLIAALRDERDLFPGIIGYDRTVVPQIVNAILSRHDFILLGLRGQAKTAGFEFPDGESRAAFRERVLRGLERVLESGAAAALLVVHKGVIRTIAEELLGQPLAQGEPELAGVVSLGRGADGIWFRGRRSNLPMGLRA